MTSVPPKRQFFKRLIELLQILKTKKKSLKQDRKFPAKTRSLTIIMNSLQVKRRERKNQVIIKEGGEKQNHDKELNRGPQHWWSEEISQEQDSQESNI